MVNKKVQNEVTQKEVKEVKKKGRRLKRSVRKTFGALFLASAIAVAAIPTDGLQAAVDPENKGESVTVDVFAAQKIPLVDPDAIIYSYPMDNCTFRFAYVDKDTGKEATDDPVAVILGFSVTGSLAGGELTIPDTMEAYRRYSVADSDATSSNVAVNLKGKFLYYKRTQPKYENGLPVYKKAPPNTPEENVDEYGNLCTVDSQGVKHPVQDTEDIYEPCYYNRHSIWAGDTMFYVRDEDDSGEPKKDEDGNIIYIESNPNDRIARASVGYIGSQYLTYDEITGEWRIAADKNSTDDDAKYGKITKPEQGIFYNNTYITTLTVGDSVMGIGNYAFVNCNFTTVSFGNNLGCVGNYAFQGCQRLTNLNFDLSCPVSVLGEGCFIGCVSLPSINIPGAVQELGDGAFEGCTALTTVKMIHTEQNFPGRLNKLGRSVFKGCSALSGLEFPTVYTDAVDVSEFEGCTSLAYIKANNATFDLKEGDLASFNFERFKQTVPSTFYLQGPEVANLHTKAREQRIAYRFNSIEFGDIYELMVDDGDYSALYQVSTPEGRIVKCEMDEGMDTVTLPETLGPQTIVGINVPTFQNNCSLKTITIPASVNYIEAGAFKGSHHLENVIFTDAEKCAEIGTGAFSTQEIADFAHQSGCDKDMDNDVYLNFVGTISPNNRPFNYAMSPGEYVNTGSRVRTYITYYSGWPTNLAVRFNETTGLNELVDYPTLSDFASGKKYTKENYVYLTGAYETAAKDAYVDYRNGSMDDFEKALINAALNIVLPDGVESIAYVVEDEEGNPVPVAVQLDNEGNIIVGGDIQKDDEGNFIYRDDKIIKGLFSFKEAKDSEIPSTSKTLTAYSIGKIGELAFQDCDTIAAVSFTGPLTAVGNYAFEDCDVLNNVSLSESIKEMGLRPFTDCEKLLNVDFNGSETFSCVDSIIFKSGADGKTLVEYLYGRRADVEAEELVGVTKIYPEAFMGTRVYNVDLTQSSITDIPQDAFRETAELNEVKLPDTCQSISKGAFTDSHIRRLHIPTSVTYIDNDACGNENKEDPYTDMTNLGDLIVYSPEGSPAHVWANKMGIEWRAEYIPTYWTVEFYDDWEHMYEPDHLIVALQVEDGYDAESAYRREGYDPPVKEGYAFERWSQSVNNVTHDMETGAVYTKVDTTVTITFYDRNFADTESVSYLILRQDEDIPYGGSVPTPANPSHEGYTFVGWLNGIVNNDKPGYMGPFTKDTDIYAQYERGDSQNGSGGTGDDGNNGTVSGGDGNGNGGNGNGGTGGDGSGSGGDGSGGSGSGSTTPLYILTVQNGSGSGSYPEGSQPVIIANDPASGQVFDHWSVSPDDVKIASLVLSASIITMPAKDVTVTAHYKAAPAGSTGSGTTGSGNNSQRPSSGSGTVTNGGTTVVIDKNGLSNTGVVSATVNGSSDNFTIKITESNAATEAALRALLAEYGSLDNIKYFPMDISLYDSTGTYKITDTTGISVTITLPLPDSLITYAGNNKAASVVNERLERLSARFTTIQGVSCITFTAEHFSPYVIYVNTGDLSSGEVSDNTPKTGDFVHPKWFLSIALACMSLVLFMQKDARKTKKVKVKAKAR